METVTTSALEAVPKIRRALCEAIYDAENARTKRDANRHRGQAFGYAQALKLLTAAGPLPAGIADREVGITLPNAEQAARTWLGTDADRLLGPRDLTAQTTEGHCRIR